MTATDLLGTKGPARLSMVLAAGVATAVAGVGVVAPAAATEAPVNDTWEGAVALSLGDTVTLDTTAATTDAVDEEANQSCGAPYTNASVWYTYTPATDGGFVADMSESDYTGGFMVFEGTPSSSTLLDCGPDSVGVGATAGTTYYLVAFSDTSTNGGNLALSLSEAPPPPTVDVTVDPSATVAKDGSVTLTGTYSCTDADWVDIEASLTQTVGRFKINGYGYVSFDQCDGEPHAFDLNVTGDNGTFAGGKAASVAWTWACGAFDCAEDYDEQTVRLRRG